MTNSEQSCLPCSQGRSPQCLGAADRPASDSSAEPCGSGNLRNAGSADVIHGSKFGRKMEWNQQTEPAAAKCHARECPVCSEVDQNTETKMMIGWAQQKLKQGLNCLCRQVQGLGPLMEEVKAGEVNQESRKCCAAGSPLSGSINRSNTP